MIFHLRGLSLRKPCASLKFSRPLLRFLRSAALAKYTLRKCVYPLHQLSLHSRASLFLFPCPKTISSLWREGRKRAVVPAAPIFKLGHVKAREMLQLGSHPRWNLKQTLGTLSFRSRLPLIRSHSPVLAYFFVSFFGYFVSSYALPLRVHDSSSLPISRIFNRDHPSLFLLSQRTFLHLLQLRVHLSFSVNSSPRLNLSRRAEYFLRIVSRAWWMAVSRATA